MGKLRNTMATMAGARLVSCNARGTGPRARPAFGAKRGVGREGERFRPNAGKGFGRPKQQPKEEEEAPVFAKPQVKDQQQQAGVPPPPPSGGGGGTWAIEVRSQEQREQADDQGGAPSVPQGPARIPAEQYKKVDENFVLSLAFLFVGLFVEGLLVAGSGFLPEDVDQFIVSTIYPAFTPTLGVFLLVSVFYGLFKTKVEPE